MGKLARAVGVVFLISVASAAQAAILTFNDRTSWSMATGGATASENFNSFVTDVLFGPSNPASLNGGMTLTALVDSGSLSDNSIDAAPTFSSEHDVDGSSLARVFNGQSGAALTPLILFGSPVTGFGADFRNLNDDILRTRVQLWTSSGLLTTLTPSIEGSGALRFWGFASDAGELITELRFTREDNDVFGMDNIDIASPVPEPTTLALFGAGIAALGRARRRRKT